MITSEDMNQYVQVTNRITNRSTTINSVPLVCSKAILAAISFASLPELRKHILYLINEHYSEEIQEEYRYLEEVSPIASLNIDVSFSATATLVG